MSQSTRCFSPSRLALALVALAVGMPLLIWFSWLRETPAFWTNAGGYPVWLRDLVLLSYYPLLLASTGGSGIYLWLLFSEPPQSRRLLWVEFVIFLLMVTVIAIAIALHFLAKG